MTTTPIRLLILGTGGMANTHAMNFSTITDVQLVAAVDLDMATVRAFAAQQGANPLTVAKAYQSFQDDGLVVVKRGVGMFVADGATRRLRVAERAHFLETVWPPVAAQIRRLGLRVEELDAQKA